MTAHLAQQTNLNQGRSFYAGFEIRGTPQTGQLILLSPVGTTLADLHWNEHGATLQSQGRTQRYDSVQDFFDSTVGFDIPITALFAWLKGIPSTVDGWQVDLTGYQLGKIVAWCTNCNAEVKIVLDAHGTTPPPR